jgi:predicted site-specific integrase-resolvase
VKLVDWAEQQGISYRTAQRWFHAGKIPGATQTASGRIYVTVDADECNGECCVDLHIECLFNKLSPADIDRFVQLLRDAGYVIEQTPQG